MLVRTLLTLFAFILGQSAAHAVTYNVFDHSDGAQSGSPVYADYGLRVDAIAGFDDLESYWSFELEPDGTSYAQGTSLATLEVDLAGDTATLSGQMRRNSDDSLWDLFVEITGLTVLGGSGDTTSIGGTTMTGTLTNGVETLTIDGKQKDGYDFTLAFADGLGADYRVGPLGETNTGAAWVDPANSSGLNIDTSYAGCCNDFLFTVAVIPLPATGGLMLVGFGALFLLRRRRA